MSGCRHALCLYKILQLQPIRLPVASAAKAPQAPGEGDIRRNTLMYIGIGTFLASWVLLFVLPCIVKGCPISELTRLTQGTISNFILLTLIFAAVAVAAAFSVDTLFRGLRRFRRFRPKLGELLVNRGYITEAQLKEALALQKLKIGEILLHLGDITEAQLKEALRLQKMQPKKLGEILIELGYVSSGQIHRALEKRYQKLGKILIDMELIDQEELRGILGRQWYSRHIGY